MRSELVIWPNFVAMLSTAIHDDWRERTGKHADAWQIAVVDDEDVDLPRDAVNRVFVVVTPGELRILTWASGATGCPRCMSRRHDLATPQYAELQSVEQRWIGGDPRVGSILELEMLASVAVTVSIALIDTYGTLLPKEVARVQMHSYEQVSSYFLPDPLCPVCGVLPEDNSADARFCPAYELKQDEHSYRRHSPVTILGDLKRLYLDSFGGIIHDLQRDTQGGLTIAVARMKLRRHEWIEPGFGRTRSYEKSEATAILEALERYGGVQPGGHRSVVVGSLNELQEDAVDPRLFGVHPEETYDSDDNFFQRFRPDAKYRWVWAHSFARDRPVLVPESLAYYYVAHDEGPAPFAFEVSNGCALGASIEEAILHGLLEVAERDGFLLTWYRRIALPRLTTSSSEVAHVDQQIRSIELETGYQIRLYDQTMENGVPAVLAHAKLPLAKRSSVTPVQLVTAGAHPALDRAAINALGEMGPFLTHLVSSFPEVSEDADRMAEDPEIVRTMADHSTLFGSSKTASWLKFLDEGPTADMGDRMRSSTRFRNATVSDDVFEMVEQFLNEGQDVIVVDQTTPEHAAGGLACVKVLVTGSLPMTFGHHLRRTDGIPRLHSVPERLGLQAFASEVNTDRPHPFP